MCLVLNALLVKFILNNVSKKSGLFRFRTTEMSALGVLLEKVACSQQNTIECSHILIMSL